MWKGGRSINSSGYVIVHRQDGCHELEHRIVMAKYIGRALTDEEVVHHINGDKTNNRIENLRLYPGHREHMLHGHGAH